MPDDVLVPIGPAVHPPRECDCLCGPDCAAAVAEPAAAAEIPQPRETPVPLLA
jgi:hypothetical protein